MSLTSVDLARDPDGRWHILICGGGGRWCYVVPIE